MSFARSSAVRLSSWLKDRWAVDREAFDKRLKAAETLYHYHSLTDAINADQEMVEDLEDDQFLFNLTMRLELAQQQTEILDKIDPDCTSTCGAIAHARPSQQSISLASNGMGNAKKSFVTVMAGPSMIGDMPSQLLVKSDPKWLPIKSERVFLIRIPTKNTQTLRFHHFGTASRKNIKTPPWIKSRPLASTIWPIFMSTKCEISCPGISINGSRESRIKTLAKGIWVIS